MNGLSDFWHGKNIVGFRFLTSNSFVFHDKTAGLSSIFHRKNMLVFWLQILIKSTIKNCKDLKIVRKMMLKLNKLSESCIFVLFWWVHWNLSINRTCVCIWVELQNYAALDEIPRELNGYESTNSVLATNPLIHHKGCKYLKIFCKMML